jgi:uncharacterized protein
VATETTHYLKPIPEIDIDNAEYWQSCREHAMKLQHCLQCGYWRFYPGPICHRCGSFDTEWAPVSGRGTIYTRSVVYRPASPAFMDDVPYVYAIVELEEGPMLPTNIVGIDPEAVEIGMAVELTYDDITDEVTLPKFRPVP